MSIRRIILSITAFALVLPASLSGQGAEHLLATVGTVVENDGRHYAYLQWQPGDAAATLGRRFAIHSKSAAIPDSAPFTRHGIQSLQTAPDTIRALLRLGDRIDYRPGAAAAQIAKIYQSTTLQLGVMPPEAEDPNFDAAGKLAYLITAAVGDPELLNQLFFLGRAHPGVMMVLGHGFVVEVPGAGVNTFEVREVEADDSDARVVGRVELDPGAPPVPPAPGPPVVVPHPDPGSHLLFSPKDNLNARFRWGVDDPLRRMLPYTFGFDLLRVDREFALSMSWDSAPPDRDALMAAMAGQDPDAPVLVQANTLAIVPDRLLTLAEAADPSDRDGYFYADDNGIPNNPPFEDGDIFWYFVAARTITGHPGEVSPGAEVQMCDRQPPRPPRIVAVDNVFVKPGTPLGWESLGGSQHFRLKIRQVPDDDPREAATGYDIYRWSNAREYLVLGGNPATNLIGHASHLPGREFVYFDDATAGSPGVTDAGTTFWFTARAVDDTACAEKNLSAHSAPKYGVIRDRVGPDAPTGEVMLCRYVPITTYDRRLDENPLDYGADTDRIQFRVQGHRDTPGIVSFDVRIEQTDKEGGTILAAASNVPFRSADGRGITYPFSEADNYTISVRGVSATGLRGTWASVVTNGEQVPTVLPYPLAVHHFNITLTADCRPASTFPEDPPPHETEDPNGKIVPIEGLLALSDDTREWRIYRRVGRDAPLTLIAKGEGETLPNPAPWSDQHPSATPGTVVCYYSQAFDQHGNPSPLRRLECVLMLNNNLAVPLLETPELLDNQGARGRVKLSWFCDPAGVDRFEVLAAASDGNSPDVTGTALSGQLSSVPLSGLVDEPAGLMFFPYQTTRLAGSMGSGPEFLVTLEIPLDRSLSFLVRAVGPGVPENRTTGGLSNLVTAMWNGPPPAEPPVIPWPKRPFPDRYEIGRDVAGYTLGEGPYHATAFPAPWDVAAGILVGMCDASVEQGTTGLPVQLHAQVGRKPEDYLFDLRTSNRDAGAGFEDLMPFMVYRYQLESTAFPAAAPNIVQCTPLIDRLSWESTGVKGDVETFIVRDPFFVFVNMSDSVPVPLDGTFSRNPSVVLGNPLDPPVPPLPAGYRPPYTEGSDVSIYIADRLPVISGAKYQYLIVSYDARGEVRRVIPVNPVQQ